MKANELMIGDWVYFHNGKVVQPRKVTGVLMPDCIYLDFGYEHHKNLHTTSLVEPIPLTKEILEKNGFKEVHGFGYSDKYPTLGWCYHNGNNYCSIDVTFYDTPINGISHLVKINRNSAIGDGINSVHNCDIDYVHQLQHAIRQCGIDKEIVIEKEPAE